MCTPLVNTFITRFQGLRPDFPSVKSNQGGGAGVITPLSTVGRLRAPAGPPFFFPTFCIAERRGDVPLKTRLGLGDFVPAGAPNPFARLRYLRAVTRCVPEALQELVRIDLHDADADAQFLAWTTRRGFTDPWARQTAGRHRALWVDQPELFGVWLTVSVASWEPEFPRLAAWNSITETEAQFDERVKQYKAEMKAAPGIAPTPTKDMSDDRHFEWTALYHVGGLLQEQIASRYDTEHTGVTASAVSLAITSVAQLIGLSLPSRQGRPPKT